VLFETGLRPTLFKGLGYFGTGLRRVWSGESFTTLTNVVTYLRITGVVKSDIDTLPFVYFSLGLNFNERLD
jgi:hypothetical protein